LQNQTVSGGNSSSGNTNKDQSSSNAGAIAGGIVGGLSGLILLVFGVLMYRRRQRRKQEDANAHRSAWSSSTRRTPPLIPEPYNLYGPSGTEHPLLPLHPGHQFASVESHPHTGHRQRKGQPGSSSGSTAAASAPFHESSSIARNVIPASDGNIPVQLRSEVENLRREVDEIRARGLYEPPPEYT
ncbi:hypothetical protein F5146DRAFT_1021959, partial [Armillaria mellea]